jgi:predicted glycosyltransferase
MRRLMIYCQDGLGLGHLRRTSNIARAVLARAPDCAVLAITDGPATPFFASLPGMDYLKLPTVIKHGESWHNGLPLDMGEILQLRTRLLLEAFDGFRPDTVLVDHLPVGAAGELAPMIDRATESRGRPRLFFGLRDVMDAPELVGRLWSDVGAYGYLERYDAIFVYGTRGVYDVASAYGIDAHARTIIDRNYVVSPPADRPECGKPQEQLVVAMGGGGHDAFPLVAAFLDALPVLRREIAIRAVILPGPTMPAAHRRLVEHRATSEAAELRTGYEDALPWINQAAAVVTMAGYNSLCESLRAGKKVLTVPRAGPSREQRTRSRLFAERHLVAALAPEMLTPERLAAELLGLFARDGIPRVREIPPMDGAQRTAALLVDGIT